MFRMKNEANRNELLMFLSSTDLAERLNGCDGVLCTLMQKIGSDVISSFTFFFWKIF